jgi:hypothetical protein
LSNVPNGSARYPPGHGENGHRQIPPDRATEDAQEANESGAVRGSDTETVAVPGANQEGRRTDDPNGPHHAIWVQMSTIGEAATKAAEDHDMDLPLIDAIARRLAQGAKEHGDKDFSATYLTSARKG